MARSKSSGGACSWFVALLTLWSMVSLVVIVVWATWPPKASVERCQAARQALVEKMEGARVMREKNRVALMNEFQQSSENQTRLQQELDDILESLRWTNLSLTNVMEEQAILKENLTALEDEVSARESEHARLSYELTVHEATVLALQVNLSSEAHQLRSCSALRSAAISQQEAAESQNTACELKSKYLLKLLGKCELQG